MSRRQHRSEYNSEPVDLFLQLADEVQNLCLKRGWNLERKFNKGYGAFKTGFFNAFGLKINGKTLGFFFKLAESEAKDTGVKITKYHTGWKEAYVHVEPGKTKVQDLLPLFEAAYGKLVGR